MTENKPVRKYSRVRRVFMLAKYYGQRVLFIPIGILVLCLLLAVSLFFAEHYLLGILELFTGDFSPRKLLKSLFVIPKGHVLNPERPDVDEVLSEREILVRASMPNNDAQKEILLRATVNAPDAAPEMLLRASAAGENV